MMTVIAWWAGGDGAQGGGAPPARLKRNKEMQAACWVFFCFFFVGNPCGEADRGQHPNRQRNRAGGAWSRTRRSKQGGYTLNLRVRGATSTGVQGGRSRQQAAGVQQQGGAADEHSGRDYPARQEQQQETEHRRGLKRVYTRTLAKSHAHLLVRAHSCFCACFVP